MGVCHTINTVTFEHEKGTNIQASVGDTVRFTGSFTSNGENDEECTWGFSGIVTPEGGSPASFDPESAATAGNTYTFDYLVTTAGKFSFTGKVSGFAENPPAPPFLEYDSTVEICLTVWDEKTPVSEDASELERPTNSTTESTPAAEGSTELSAPGGSATERTAPSGGFNEEA